MDLIEFVPLQDAARLAATPGTVVHTTNPACRMDATNRSGRSDPALDRDIDAALNEPDPARRLALLGSADRRALEARVLPLFTAPVLLASRAGVRYDVGDSGSSEMTSAMRAHPQ